MPGGDFEGSSSDAGSTTTWDVFPARSLSNAISLFYALPWNLRHIVRTVIGVGLLILGAIGSLLPVVPGFIFFAAGIAVLGTDHAIVRRLRPYLHRARAWLERHGILKPQKL